MPSGSGHIVAHNDSGEDNVGKKELIIGVDYSDDVGVAFRNGEVGATPLIRRIVDNAVAAGVTTVCRRVSGVGLLTCRTRVGTPAMTKERGRLLQRPGRKLEGNVRQSSSFSSSAGCESSRRTRTNRFS